MKKILLTVLIAIIGITTNAQDKNKNAKYTEKVYGNCESCKKRIEKAALSVNGVKSAIWVVDTKKLKLSLDENNCSLTQVNQAIAKAGHDNDELKASDQVYNNLPNCCQYERKK